MISVQDLPTLNALLNSLSALLLILGFIQIRRRHVSGHRTVMLAAFGTSVAFLASYLTYHYYAGSKHFEGEGWVRPLYFAVLISHSVLAAAVIPLVLMTLTRGLRQRYAAHRTLARWTLPIWLYVSITGVAVYLMLYHLA